MRTYRLTPRTNRETGHSTKLLKIKKFYFVLQTSPLTECNLTAADVRVTDDLHGTHR